MNLDDIYVMRVQTKKIHAILERGNLKSVTRNAPDMSQAKQVILPALNVTHLPEADLRSSHMVLILSDSYRG